MATKLTINDDASVEKAVNYILDFSKRVKTLKQVIQIKDAIEISSTNILAKNTFYYLFNNLSDIEEFKERCNNCLKHFSSSHNKIVALTEKKILKKSVVMTASYSSLITSSLIEAKKQDKNFHVAVLETRPLLEGRKTSLELAKENVDVHYFVDYAVRVITKKADICFLPCNHISGDGRIYTFLGGELIAELCRKRNVQLFIVTNGWKLDVKSQFKYDDSSEKTIWEKSPKNIHVNSHTFEKINPALVSGIISELGIFDVKEFIKQTKEAYPFLG